jgi:hypothetical protein
MGESLDKNAILEVLSRVESKGNAEHYHGWDWVPANVIVRIRTEVEALAAKERISDNDLVLWWLFKLVILFCAIVGAVYLILGGIAWAVQTFHIQIFQ